MILTVTPNSSVDCVLFMEEFQPGAANRPHKMVLSVGGKALDASVVLQTLGVENTALSFTAGATGQQLVGLLDNYGIKHDLVLAEGQTRTANVLVETKYHRHSHLTTPGYLVPPEAYQNFIGKCRHYLPNAKWVVTGGSLPAGGIAEPASRTDVTTDRAVINRSAGSAGHSLPAGQSGHTWAHLL